MVDRRKLLSAEELRSSGYLAEANRRFFHPLGLALALDEHGELTILDERDDPEGWVFHIDDALVDAVERLAEIEAERRPVREAALGFWIQPIP